MEGEEGVGRYAEFLLERIAQCVAEDTKDTHALQPKPCQYANLSGYPFEVQKLLQQARKRPNF